MIQSQPEIESNATLMESIQKLSDRMMQLGGGKLNITMQGKWEVQDRERCHQIYNIISEAVANALRHANASQINIDCKCGPAGMTITIENDGDAFPSHLHEGMGLPIMRHRAASIGGTFTIEGGTGQQTRVVCTIPHTAAADKKAFPRDGQRLNTTA
jgi:signal transduction histidine kinase